jgi:hypothetical protein
MAETCSTHGALRSVYCTGVLNAAEERLFGRSVHICEGRIKLSLKWAVGLKT